MKALMFDRCGALNTNSKTTMLQLHCHHFIHCVARSVTISSLVFALAIYLATIASSALLYKLLLLKLAADWKDDQYSKTCAL